ncbi:hypothetical protein DL766_007339 [Monosporascus sp. MC13-8B]|uniref:VPS9 domain-containing protein n=1 Tax=Monosporascus cannonballus TaxID=155416 RepID=A0ABY0H9L3_9PEZI|nr:hypothetical protein DL762_005330 [Monosporascus cannonballus]RYO99761.1 hypothetical protein DL763_001260 [Monosporascus cannonballus]RYP24130.1 hypothetical protein DL766_007339 [Monosporascus sp. MC13-8B]
MGVLIAMRQLRARVTSVLMTPVTPTKGAESRPGSLRHTKSFPRHQISESNDPLKRPQRASTFQDGTVPDITIEETSSTFVSESSEEPMELPRASVDMDEIPIELISLIDNFIDSLSAKVHSKPPDIDNLSKLFQDFYHTAASHVQTHISNLATRQSRAASSAPGLPAASRTSSAASLLRAKAASLGNKEKSKGASTKESEQQMLTAEEFADRKRARKALEQKKITLEEAVERRLCEGIYDRIYRHRSTQDEAQDDRLRSKTAALGLVGIGPADLGVDLGELPSDDPDALGKKNEEIREYLAQARKDLVIMNEKRYPLGKLNYLKACHKSIVDTLSHFHPSSSADEIMPMLIYTLITMPPEKLNVISDANFIRRFRWEEKMEGEAAYCLTNLEAAITFLDTVDLASLRSNEAQSGQPKLESESAAPRAGTFPPAYTASLSAATSSPATTTTENAAGLQPMPGGASQRRRFSDLINTPAQAIGNASDSLFNTADQGFKNIGASLGDSYKFLLGKLRDTTAEGKALVVPRTLDDARKLIGTPPPDEDGSIDNRVPTLGSEAAERPGPTVEDRVLSLVGGKKTARDHSTDSTRSARSAGSSKRVLFAEDNKETSSSPAAASTSPSANAPLVESMRSLGNSLNPMNRFSGMSMMRGFGRPAPQTPTKDADDKPVDGGDLSKAFPDIAAVLPPKDVPKIKPPNKRFMELQNPSDLRLSEVMELLRDYRRLATALRDMDAFKE